MPKPRPDRSDYVCVFSVLFQNESELLLGAPGVYNWHGTVLIYRDGSAVGPQASRIVSPGRLLKRDINQGEFQFLNVAEASTTEHTKAFSLTGCVYMSYF